MCPGQTVLCEMQGPQRWMSREKLDCPVKPGKAASKLSLNESPEREALHKEPNMQVSVYRVGELVSDEHILAGMAELRQKWRA